MPNEDRNEDGQTPVAAPEGVAIITDPQSAAVLLKDPRRRILEMALEPLSAVEMAQRLGETRQRVGYHVRQLVEAGLLEDLEISRRGAMIDKRYRASAGAYALAPALLGPLAARVESSPDRESLVYLLGAVNEIQDDLAHVLSARSSPEERLPTLTLSTRLRFRDAGERAAFAEALVTALTEVVGRHASPFEGDDGTPGEGAPFRLTLTLHPTESRASHASPSGHAARAPAHPNPEPHTPARPTIEDKPNHKDEPNHE